MKKLLYVFCFGFALIMSATPNAQETFLQANKYYKENEMVKALDLYESIAHKGHAVWFNMGNAHFELGNYVLAMLYWQKSKVGASAKQLILIDSYIAQARSRQHLLVPESSLKDRLYDGIARSMNDVPLLFIQWCALAAWYIFFAMFFIFFRRYFSIPVRNVMTVFFLGIILVPIAIKSREHTLVRALVVQPDVALHAGPNNNYHVLARLGLADDIILEHNAGDWCKVCKGNLDGWIPAKSISTI